MAAMFSIALIVKNEEHNLNRILGSIAGLTDDLVIVDTGSTDKTVEIAEKYTNRIFFFDWVKDFAKARNYAFSKCKYDWIMWLDADDVLHAQDVALLKAQFPVVTQDPNVHFILMNYHYSVAINAEAAAGGSWSEKDTPIATLVRERIIKKPFAVWHSRCHEHILVDFTKSVTIDAAVWHMRSAQDIVADQNRNIEIMKIEVSENPSDRNLFYLAQEYSDSGQFDIAIETYNKAYEKTQQVDIKFQASYKAGMCNIHLKKRREAIPYFLRAVGHQTDYREPFVDLCNLYFEEKENSKAVVWGEAALQIKEPKHPFMVTQKHYYTWFPHDTLAKAYFALKRFDEAKAHGEKLYEYLRIPSILNDLKNIEAGKRGEYKRPSTPVKLNLGCGPKTQVGYVNCDLFPGPGIDEVFSLDEVPYADSTVDEIASEHSLEHLPRLKAEAAIREWYRVLKPGGKVDLKIPDLEGCCYGFLNDKANREWYSWTIYGIQDHRHTDYPLKDKVNYGQIHYTGFTDVTIRKLMESTGFVIDSLSKYDGWGTPSLHITAHKLVASNSQKIAFVNNSLNPRYLSYGDYWLDAFRAAGHQVTEYRYDAIKTLPGGFDAYFFIEKRYEAAEIPNGLAPLLLYTQEQPPLDFLKRFDRIFTPNLGDLTNWDREGIHVKLIPNTDHLKQIEKVLDTSKPKTDIIIPSYKNLPYLKLTLESVRRNTKNYNLIVCNSGDDQSVRDYLREQKDITLIDSEAKQNFSKNINSGLKLSRNDVVLLNNDVIVGPGWLEAMQSSSFDITNPYSNCDIGWIHQLSEVCDRVTLTPNMTIENSPVKALFDWSPNRKEIIPRPWVAFYATYIKRRVIDSVGLLDPHFVNGGEDYDYCRRATKQNFTCGHVFSSWVFHFGGKTRKVNEDENFQQHHAENDHNNAIMKFKDRETICIYTGRAYEPWSVNNINSKGIGGSETCAALLAQEFAARGYRSVVIGDCLGMEGNYEKVEYIDHTKWESFKETNYIDYFISSRCVFPLGHQIKNGKNYVWSHDIFIPESTYRHPTHSEKVNKFICLSPWHVDFFADHHKVDKSKIVIQENGLDLSRYADYDKIEKDPYRLFYSSSPDRGLLTLLQQFKEIKKEFSKANLHIFYGFFNWKSAIEQRKNAEEMEHVRQIEEMMKQDGVYYHDRVPQNVLAKEQMKSSLWVYPTLFTETHCITAREAMLAGAIPICTDLAGLSALPDSGAVKVQSPKECLDQALRLLRYPYLQKSYRDHGRSHVIKHCGWDTVANKWVKMFQET